MRTGSSRHAAIAIRDAARRWGRGLRQFGRDPSGASAIEFALVALPLIYLLLATLQVGLVFFANYTLENATAQGARMLRTGQAQNQKFDAAKFKAEVCKHITAPLSCANLKLDVRRFTNFSSADLTQPLDSSGKIKPNFTYDPGLGGDVVVVRAFYPLDLPTLLPIEIRMSDMADGNRLIVATVAFRNEPFQVTSTN
jgi:Flp pilus assembly protein TadG